MPCAYTQEQLYAYLDGELPPDEAHAIERHLQECPACQEAVAAHRRLQALLRATLEEEAVPTRLWPTIQQRLAQARRLTQTPARRSTRQRLWRGGGAIAALCLLAWLGLRWWVAPGAAVVQEMVDSHIRARLMVAPYTQVSARPEDIQVWFRDKVDFAVPVPSLPPERYTFQGVRLNYFLNRRVAELGYATGSHLLSFFMFAEPNLTLPATHTVQAGTRTLTVQQRKGYTAILWKDGDMVCGLVSDLQAAALVALLQAVRPAPAPS